MSGFTVTNKQGSTGSEGNVQTFAVAATHSTLLAPGDAVVLTGTSNVDGVPEVDTAPAATAGTGVIAFVDFILAGENLTETGLPALTAGTVKVDIDPLRTYEVDSDATLAAVDVGLNIGINATTATKSGGLTISNMNIDDATKAVTQTLPWRIIALLEDDAGVLGNRAMVRPNATTQSDGSAGI
jgi:hypothetical protein